jgi:hypothetical protein
MFKKYKLNASSEVSGTLRSQKNQKNPFYVFVLVLIFTVIFIIVPIILVKSASADTLLWTFTNPSEFIFDAKEVEFLSGEARLKVREDWYNTSWVKRKAIAINNSNNPDNLTNFQMRITIPYSAGMQNNFNDIRFTDGTGKTRIDYWLESKVDSNQATFWVKVPNIPANQISKIYVYYGNPEALSLSDPNKVFLFFDDAESGDINTKWEAVSGNPRFTYTSSLTYEGNWFQDLVTNYHGPMTTYTDRHRPMAIYIPSERKTFFVFGSADQYAEIGYFDHISKKFSEPVEVGFIGKDAHKNPSIFIDEQGYIYVFYGSHGSTMYTKRSVYPYNIYSWENRATIEGHTYPQSWQLKSGEIIHFYRGGDSKGFYRISTDGAVTWGDPVRWVDFGGTTWTYAMTIAENGAYPRTVHAVWTIREGGGLPRRNVYYARSEDGGLTWVKSDGTPYTLPITEANAEKILDSGADQVQSSDVQVDSQGNVYALYTQGYESGCTWKILRLTRATKHWDTFDVGASCDHQFDVGALVIRNDSDFRLYLPSIPVQPGEDGGDIEEWQSLNKGSTWTKTKNITSGSTYSHNFIRAVYNSDPDFRAFWGYADSSPNAADKTTTLYYYGANSPIGEKIIKGDGNSTILLNGGDEENIIRAKNLNVSDFILEADVRPMARLSVLATRVGLTGDNYSLRTNYEGSRIHLYKNGIYTELGNTTKRDHQDFHKWVVKMSGNKINFSWDGTTLLNVTDTNSSIASGSIGARVRDGSIEMDNVRVRQYTLIEPTFSLSEEVGMYPTDNPTITPIVSKSIEFDNITKFSAVASADVRYQLSNDSGNTWYWYDNSNWQITMGGYESANTAEEIDNNIETFPKGSGFFTFRVYLHSDGNTSVSITSVDLVYTNEIDSQNPPTASSYLLTNGKVNPTDVKGVPSFSAIFNDPDIEDVGVGYQIQVNTNTSFTGTSMWDSGKVSMSPVSNGAMSPDITYNGASLAENGETYYWRIKFWDNTGLEGLWSIVAQFTMEEVNIEPVPVVPNPPISPSPPVAPVSPSPPVAPYQETIPASQNIPKTGIFDNSVSIIIFGYSLIIISFSLYIMGDLPEKMFYILKNQYKTSKENREQLKIGRRRNHLEKQFEKGVYKGF